MKKMVVTGSSGLIGSEVVNFFANNGWEVYGIDNNLRADFFGKSGDTRWNQKRLEKTYKNFKHNEIDIRNRSEILNFLKLVKPDVIVHAAAQPSHDLAASRPFDDFDVNAVGTLNLLESTRQYNKDAIFISTHKRFYY